MFFFHHYVIFILLECCDWNRKKTLYSYLHLKHRCRNTNLINLWVFSCVFRKTSRNWSCLFFTHCSISIHQSSLQLFNYRFIDQSWTSGVFVRLLVGRWRVSRFVRVRVFDEFSTLSHPCLFVIFLFYRRNLHGDQCRISIEKKQL